MVKEYYRPIKSKKLLALLIRNDFTSKQGTKHGKYQNEDNLTIIIPRHKTLSPGVSQEICQLLETKANIPKSELKKLF